MVNALPAQTQKYETKHSRGINLIPQEYTQSPRNKIINKTLSGTGIVLIVVYILGLLGLFAFSYFLNIQADKLNMTKDALISDVKKLQKKESLLHTIKNRTSLARKILENTTPLTLEKFNKIIPMIPADVQILDAETTNNAVILSAKSKNPAAIQNLLSSFENINLTEVAVQTLNSSAGQYNIKIHVQ